jgi:hypothetical protein
MKRRREDEQNNEEQRARSMMRQFRELPAVERYVFAFADDCRIYYLLLQNQNLLQPPLLYAANCGWRSCSLVSAKHARP